jgi:hypothetical protein
VVRLLPPLQDRTVTVPIVSLTANKSLDRMPQSAVSSGRLVRCGRCSSCPQRPLRETPPGAPGEYSLRSRAGRPFPQRMRQERHNRSIRPLASPATLPGYSARAPFLT